MKQQHTKKIKLSKKGINIIQTIREKGKYKPTYSDKEPALMTLIKIGLVEWRTDYRGVIETELGKTIDIS